MENANALVAQTAALVAYLDEEEDEAIRQAMLAVARIAVAEVMEMEEPGVDPALLENSWVYITININEYHLMGDPVFKMHFRMSRTVFELLVVTVAEHLRVKGRMRRERTPFQDIMLMVLWIMATPDSFRSVSLKFGRRPSALWYFYSYIIEALRELAPQYIVWPDAEERASIKNEFQEATGFPGVVGCIDCTHVYITAPVIDSPQYVNRHDTHSINVQTVVDHRLVVRSLQVGEVGSMNDKRVFRRSPLCHNLLTKQGEERLVNPDEHLVGDGGYTLTDFMMIPFQNDVRMNDAQRRFNKKLSQCRVRVENAYARGKGYWRRLKFLHARNEAVLTDHITASFVLHNFVILNGDELWRANELERPIAANEVLGDEGHVDDFLDPNELELADEDLMDAAQARGAEKRIFIMYNLLPLE